MPHPLPLVLALTACALLPGCVEDAGGSLDWSLRGSFVEGRDPADLDDLRARVEARGGTVAILESYPEQFHATKLSADGCEALRAELDTVRYLSEVGSCAPG